MENFDDLPSLVLERIVEFMDYGSRRACRMVSRTIKSYVDEFGLSIKIDSREAACRDLRNTVVATEARILNLETYDLEPEKIRYWKRAIFSGAVDFTLMNDRMFPDFNNLRILIFCGDALTAQQAFVHHSEASHCLHRLAELHIQLHQDYLLEQALDKVCSELTLQDNEASTFTSRVTKNVSTLLRIIRSPVLKLLFVSIYELPGIAAHQDFWEYHPLFEFLRYHQHSLETLVLPSLELGRARGPGGNFESMNNSIQLKRICLGSRPSQVLPNHWRSFILQQNLLDTLCIFTRPFEGDSPCPWLSSVMLNNASTLTDVNLSCKGWSFGHGDQVPWNCIDMRIFMVLESLKYFELNGSGYITLINLNDLPTASLKRLKLFATKIAKDFDGILFLKASSPEILILENLSKIGWFRDRKYLFGFTNQILRSRKLIQFSIKFPGRSNEFPLSSWYSDTPTIHGVQIDTMDLGKMMKYYYEPDRRHRDHEPPLVFPSRNQSYTIRTNTNSGKIYDIRQMKIGLKFILEHIKRWSSGIEILVGSGRRLSRSRFPRTTDTILSDDVFAKGSIDDIDWEC